MGHCRCVTISTALCYRLPMADFESFKNLTAGINSILSSGAIIVGGYWAYSKFIRTREGSPKITFWVELDFVSRHGNFWIAEAIAQIGNKGLVRHLMKKFTFHISYATSSDELREKEPSTLDFPRTARKGSWMPSETFVDPGVRTQYTAVILIPVEASVVLIHGKFFYSDNDWHTADKVIAVPNSAPGTGRHSSRRLRNRPISSSGLSAKDKSPTFREAGITAQRLGRF